MLSVEIADLLSATSFTRPAVSLPTVVSTVPRRSFIPSTTVFSAFLASSVLTNSVVAYALRSIVPPRTSHPAVGVVTYATLSPDLMRVPFISVPPPVVILYTSPALGVIVPSVTAAVRAANVA